MIAPSGVVYVAAVYGPGTTIRKPWLSVCILCSPGTNIRPMSVKDREGNCTVVTCVTDNTIRAMR
ncbi:hypothetical protein DPMN_026613 [Dreissena polymorpha]|uniref:Uncharacterized protein n=1 Tax=Dreissena polymorpha TaxID=45954 RepID=A0A9D4RER8_DREPO|nr:hypothetical protein DPMN_026613 [Dreissena polymorpha]